MVPENPVRVALSMNCETWLNRELGADAEWLKTARLNLPEALLDILGNADLLRTFFRPYDIQKVFQDIIYPLLGFKISDI